MGWRPSILLEGGVWILRDTPPNFMDPTICKAAEAEEDPAAELGIVGDPRWPGAWDAPVTSCVGSEIGDEILHS